MSANCPNTLNYTQSHEWIDSDHSSNTYVIGITDHAQSLLGDIVFLELPKVGRIVKAGEACAVVESVKAASDIYASISGEIIAINEAAVNAPESLNSDAYGTWLFKIQATPEAFSQANLLNADAYLKEIGA